MIAGEPLLQPWFAARHAARTALYALVVGGLVLVPLWRSLTPSQRAHGAVLALVVAWVYAVRLDRGHDGRALDLFENGAGTTSSSTSCAGWAGFRSRSRSAGGFAVRSDQRAFFRITVKDVQTNSI